MREKIHYLKFCMSCSAGQAGHLASPLPPIFFIRQLQDLTDSVTDKLFPLPPVLDPSEGCLTV